ncbi:MAG TPA: hypothetical protein DEF85_00945 [Clostridiaceae bacterium]|nr:hypothetical protein [Clostridiaceae bacterium]HBF76993.1 hypothetical protein [Clostridiaceae bacterium]HBG38433.1 hypothetical protein [Clostridiaceae bacterium]HBN28685.1 hypothetical protein [Clostridiaceae bacterium]HBX47455.1 hypothetical protein [Clostridiaceae bacterium]
MRRDKWLLFISAIIPGVGYMYLGLIRKGIEALILFLIIGPIFRLIGISWLTNIVRFPFWLYTFFTTYEIATQQDLGVYVPDTDFINIKKPNKNVNMSDKNIAILKNVLAAVLIIAGLIVILNKAFAGNEVYNLIISYIKTYLFPVLLIFGGLYILFRNSGK